MCGAGLTGHTYTHTLPGTQVRDANEALSALSLLFPPVSMLEFLEEEVADQYLGVLSSRWAALVPRMGTRTQKLRSEELGCFTAVSAVAKELDEDFRLADQLLNCEHAIYMEGVEQLRAATAATEDARFPPAWAQHVSLFLQTFLTGLCMKEALLADWRAHPASVSPDTLRVYAHALIAPTTVCASEVERLIFMVKQAQRANDC